MLITEVKEGTKLELQIYDELDDKIKLTCVSELQWADDEKTACIAAPIYEGILYPIHRNTLIAVSFLGNEVAGMVASLYKFNARVQYRFREGNVELLLIRVESEIIKIQRRQFFRFECSVPVRYRVIKSMKPLEFENEDYISTFSRDLSGGGLSIKLMEPVERKKYVECELILGERRKIVFIGRVLRLTKYGPEEKYNYEIGVEFTQIHPISRDKVIKYIFEQQRKLRKKGLI
ncbi:MAG: flagellar brake protein [Acetivibrionales bacterium]